MKYKTELMEKILKSPQAMEMMEVISPVYGNAYVFLWLMQVTAMELEGITSFPEEFKKQVTPATATWSISYWENAYNIIPDQSWTLEQRRQNLIDSINYRAPMNPEKMRRTVENILGLPTEIQENVSKNKFRLIVEGWPGSLKKARETINKGKPAHLIYDIIIKERIEAALKAFYDISVTEAEKFLVSRFDEPFIPQDFVRVADENGIILLDENGEILIY